MEFSIYRGDGGWSSCPGGLSRLAKLHRLSKLLKLNRVPGKSSLALKAFKVYEVKEDCLELVK